MNLKDEVSPCANSICHTKSLNIWKPIIKMTITFSNTLIKNVFNLVLLNDDFRWKLFCKNPSRFLINSIQMLQYSEYSHKTYSTDSHSHSQKKLALLLFLALCLPSSSFRPWIPDLNLNKSLEPTGIVIFILIFFYMYIIFILLYSTCILF